MTKPFWLSFYWDPAKQGEFEYHGPWWISGQRVSDQAWTIVAAVHAESGLLAIHLMRSCFDTDPGELEVRFVNEQEPGWAPYCDRFGEADWMQWEPEPYHPFVMPKFSETAPVCETCGRASTDDVHNPTPANYPPMREKTDATR